MNTGKGVADVLNGLIGMMPDLAWLIIVLTAAFGMFLTGYAMLRLYQANDAADGTGMNWVVAGVIGSALTCCTIVIGSFSYHYTG